MHWSESLREELDMTDASDDGIFCMSLQDYLQYFAVTSLCSE